MRTCVNLKLAIASRSRTSLAQVVLIQSQQQTLSRLFSIQNEINQHSNIKQNMHFIQIIIYSKILNRLRQIQIF